MGGKRAAPAQSPHAPMVDQMGAACISGRRVPRSIAQQLTTLEVPLSIARYCLVMAVLDTAVAANRLIGDALLDHRRIVNAINRRRRCRCRTQRHNPRGTELKSAGIAFVCKLVHNLGRCDELQIYSYRAVARSPLNVFGPKVPWISR